MYNPFFKANFSQTSTIAQDIQTDPKYRLEINNCIERFISKDWGDLTDDDIKSNNEAIVYNDRILASYKTSKGKIYRHPCVLITSTSRIWVCAFRYAAHSFRDILHLI